MTDVFGRYIMYLKSMLRCGAWVCALDLGFRVILSFLAGKRPGLTTLRSARTFLDDDYSSACAWMGLALRVGFQYP